MNVPVQVLSSRRLSQKRKPVVDERVNHVLVLDAES
jgi:hypothetical protein